MEKIYIQDNTTNIIYFLKGVSEISPTLSNTVTEYPTSEGSNISDHYYKEANTLNFSLNVDGYDNTNESYYIDNSGIKRQLNYDETKKLLSTWIEDGTRLDIQTNHKLFKSMLLVSMNWKEDKDEWTIFKPQLGFKEVRVAQLQTTTLHALNVVSESEYSTEVDTGTNNGSETSLASEVGGVIGDAAIGAGIGAIVGSIIPGVGTAIGAGIGAGVGAIVGFFKRIF